MVMERWMNSASTAYLFGTYGGGISATAAEGLKERMQLSTQVVMTVIADNSAIVDQVFQMDHIHDIFV